MRGSGHNDAGTVAELLVELRKLRDAAILAGCFDGRLAEASDVVTGCVCDGSGQPTHAHVSAPQACHVSANVYCGCGRVSSG